MVVALSEVRVDIVAPHEEARFRELMQTHHYLGALPGMPAFFHGIDDPRRRQGRRHALATVLALATAATLCGMRGYKAISEWVDDLGPKALERFGVRRRNGHSRPPSRSATRSPASD